jgi:ubiquinone/menaquinone biosynthesis C-methylase UbiE
MAIVERDAPYPELKKSHTAAHKGTPWSDYKPPASAPVWNIIQGFGNYWLLMAAIELGAFDTLQKIGPCPLEPLAEATGLSHRSALFLFDGLVAIGMIEQYRDVYKLGDLASRYLTSDAVASMADLIGVAPGPLENWEELTETFRRGTPRQPIENDPEGFYVPLVEATFPTMLRAATRADLKIGYSRTPNLRLLDLGAGGAPWSVAVLSQNPTATTVVNDYEGVLEVAKRRIAAAGIADYESRVEYLPGDFHTVELEPNSFDMVILGHILRTEGDEGAQHMIDRAYAALRPGGRVIVSDYFRDNTRKFNPFGVLMGVTMVAATRQGHTFTNEEVTAWIRATGFEALRLIEPIGFNSMYVASKPE